jgi:putative transcriptional regulator
MAGLDPAIHALLFDARQRKKRRGCQSAGITSWMKAGRQRMRSMTQKEIEAAARSDPDSQPLTPADFARMKRTPQVKIIRRALGLSQDDFAARYHIPIGTLRDWEQGRAVPDQAARAYLGDRARPGGGAEALGVSKRKVG